MPWLREIERKKRKRKGNKERPLRLKRQRLLLPDRSKLNCTRGRMLSQGEELSATWMPEPW